MSNSFNKIYVFSDQKKMKNWQKFIYFYTP